MSERLEKLLKLHEANPEDTFCTYGIAMEYIKAGQADEAMTWLDKTIGLDDGYAYAYFQKAQAMARAGKTDAARAAIEHGLVAADASGDRKAAEELRALNETLE